MLSMNYPTSFKEFLEIADNIGETLVGYGNPSAKILIIANEPGTANEFVKENDIKQNLHLWQTNVKKCTDFSELLNVFEDRSNFWNRFNPLFPYFGQRFVQAVFKDGGDIPFNDNKRPTSRTYKQYQKLTDFIKYSNECKLTQFDCIDLFKSVFVMDFSSVPGSKSKDIKLQEKSNSINNRLPLFESTFVQSFPIIIVAAGHYIRDISSLNDLTKIFKSFEFIKQEPDWLNIHKRLDGKGILIHTKHLAFVSDNYLKQIADICRPYFSTK